MPDFSIFISLDTVRIGHRASQLGQMRRINTVPTVLQVGHLCYAIADQLDATRSKAPDDPADGKALEISCVFGRRS